MYIPFIFDHFKELVVIKNLFSDILKEVKNKQAKNNKWYQT